MEEHIDPSFKGDREELRRIALNNPQMFARLVRSNNPRIIDEVRAAVVNDDPLPTRCYAGKSDHRHCLEHRS